MWSDALSSKLDGEMRARIIGVDAQMHAFDFLYGVSLGCLLLCHTDNLSKSLQEKSLAAAKLTLDVLVSLRDENNFNNFYACVLAHQVRFQVDAPTLPRKRRVPQRLQVGTISGAFHSNL